MILAGKGGFVTVDQSLARSPGEERAVSTMIVSGAAELGIVPEKRTDDMRLSRTEFMNLMIVQFVRGTARQRASVRPHLQDSSTIEPFARVTKYGHDRGTETRQPGR